MNGGYGERRGGYRGRGRGRGGSRGQGRSNYGNADSSRGEGHGEGNRGRGRGYDPNHRVGFRALEEASKQTPTEALMFCNKQGFLSLMQDTELRKDMVDLVLTTLNQALQDETMAAFKSDLKHFLLGEGLPFLKETCINRYTNEISTGCGTRIHSLIQSLENYLQIFHRLCAMDTLAIKTLIQPVKSLKLMLFGAAVSENQLKSVSDLYSQATKEVEDTEREAALKEMRDRIIKKTGRVSTDIRPDTDFREISVYPTEDDMRAFVSLRKHLVKGAFADVDDYLDIQFRLLREDFVSTVRKGIKDFKDNPNLSGSKRFRSGDVKVYENFTILSPSFGKSGITYLIRIDRSNKMFKRHNWVSSKRLMYGSLLCLSQDCFERIYLFATIAERKAEVMAKDGVFEIQFLPESQEKFDQLANPDLPFMAVESMAYFEAYYHVLNGMKQLNASNFPLSQYIVKVQQQISQPAYLTMHDRVLRLITKSGHVAGPVSVSDLLSRSYNQLSVGLHVYDDWTYGGSTSPPSAEQMGFNPAQYEAFKMALTNEFVVIQGPPGTGKTYVGLKIAEALLYNFYNVPCGEEKDDSSISGEKKHALGSSADNAEERRNNCPPQMLQQMLVVCYTNHALDQFLEGMLDFCPIEEMVRVGSRSNNALLEPCNIGKQRGRRSRQLHHAHMELRAKKDNFKEHNNLEQLKKWLELSKTSLLHHDTPGLFAGQDLLYSQMCEFAFILSKQGDNPKNAVARWLCCDAATFAAANADTSFDAAGLVEELGNEDQEAESVDVVGEVEREMENRMGDGDDENDNFFKLLRARSSVSQSAVDESDSFQAVRLTKQQYWKYKKHLECQLSVKDAMGVEDVEGLNGLITGVGYNIIENMPLNNRWSLYRYLVRKFQTEVYSQFKQLQSSYTSIVRLGDDLRKQEDIETLRKAKVIGMTTTGAARMQSVLQQVGPEIVVVEEAAEVLEAHIITALSKHCKHLILIGDHKQLKPNPTVFELARDYHLDLSLFERMVKNGLPVKTLNIQHRMRPEVSKYIRKHIYDELHDHSSVLNREHIEGVEKSVFFFNHHEMESSDDQIMSHSNEFEAEMVVGLTRYLLRQRSYEAHDITIITMYTGQLLLIKRKMPKAEFEGVKITSVDNFQGEENKIMIISLVRSNEQEKLGFIEIENRVCVSLSRAQYGMYIFGNFDMLCKKSELWRSMVSEAKKAGEFGDSLTLSCKRHRNPCKIEKASDFKDKAPTGGCIRVCKRTLPCGHTCKMTCHSRDLEHKLYKCTEACPKIHSNCGHKCTRMCHQECGKCPEKIRARLPCTHVRLVECHLVYEPEANIPCYEPCAKSLSCGHKCTRRCSESCTELCLEKVEQMCSRCQELKAVNCNEASRNMTSYTPGGLQYTYKCDTPCDEILACGHRCSGTCYTCCVDGHQKCAQPCGKSLKCGHFCPKICYDCSTSGECASCKAPCPYQCSHNAKCRSLCGLACEFHKPAKKCGWGCEHSHCSKDCGESCDHIPCDYQCEKMKKCGRKTCGLVYQCVSLCGESCLSLCPKCDLPKRTEGFLSAVDRQAAGVDSLTVTALSLWVQLQDCKHTVPVEYMDHLVYSSPPYSTVTCPYRTCAKPVWNTARYVTRTRRPPPRAVPPIPAPRTTVPGDNSYGQPTTTVRVAPSLNVNPISSTQINRELDSITQQLQDHKLQNDVSASTYRSNLSARTSSKPAAAAFMQADEYSDDWM